MTDYINATYAMEMFTSTATSFNGQEKVETFAVSITETIEALLEQAVSRVGKQTSSMSKEEKIELVKDLEASGVFQIKGAVDHVALLIGVSKYTIYNYLKKIRTEQDLNRF
jgi:predicted transcriptional regulator YheO